MASRDGSVGSALSPNQHAKRGRGPSLSAGASGNDMSEDEDDDIGSDDYSCSALGNKKNRSSRNKESSVTCKEVDTPNPPDSGCLVCGLDTDHSNLLLCEQCNGEYHTYCLRPPLRSVPDSDWYCDRCKKNSGSVGGETFPPNPPKKKLSHGGHQVADALTSLANDPLETMVSALPPSHKSRFGEIVWAQGGVGYGWWPACIYDPRLTVGTARIQAMKNLGKKYLVFFFECGTAPAFEIIGDHRILSWAQGLLEDHHLGKTARSHSKQRLAQFRTALFVATVEENKPKQFRLDWNHQGNNKSNNNSKTLAGSSELGSAASLGESENGEITTTITAKSRKAQPKPLPRKPQTDPQKIAEGNQPQEKTGAPLPGQPNQHSSNNKRSFGAGYEQANASYLERLPPSKRRKRPYNGQQQPASTVVGAASSPRHESTDQEWFVRVQRASQAFVVIHPDGGLGEQEATVIGFVRINPHNSTFVHLRRVIEMELVPDVIASEWEWRFVVPNLGPLSLKQESKFALSLLLQAQSGDGSMQNPIQVTLLDPPRIRVQHSGGHSNSSMASHSRR